MTSIKKYFKQQLTMKERMAVKSVAAAVVPYRLRYSNGIWSKFKFLENSQFYSIERQYGIQLQGLKETLQTAIKFNKYYRAVFSGIGLNEKEIEACSDIYGLLRQIPFLTKADVRNNLDILVNENVNSKAIVPKTTSGSTGKPLDFVNSKECLEWEMAFMWRHWANASRWRPGKKMAFLRTYIPRSNLKDPIWYYDPWTKIVWASAYNMNDENISVYVDMLIRKRPNVLVGYPSSIFILAEYLLRNRKSLEVGGVVTSSESLPDYQREVIEEAFQLSVAENYGLTERVVGLGKCSHGLGYHDWYEYGITEIVDENGDNVTTPGMTGEIVGTNFTNNKALPWIRYKTGDIAEYCEPFMCTCGSKLPIITKKIIGRTDDILFSNNGCRVPGVNFYTMFQQYVRQIKNFQLYQSDRDRIVIRLVVNDEYTSDIGEQFKSKIWQRVGRTMLLDIEIMDEIPREENGKYKCIKRDKEIDLFWKVNNAQEVVL